ncbi:hypothetical protein SCODD09_00886 [Streptococcus constellatus]|nr:hypothetical protein SCODD09_00886 [Streptococcus constellatus]
MGSRFRENTDLVNKVWVTVGMTSRETGGGIAHPAGRGIYNFSKIATVDVSTLAKDADEYSPQYDNGSGYPNDTVNLKIKEKIISKFQQEQLIRPNLIRLLQLIKTLVK